MARHARGSARRRPVRAGAVGRRQAARHGALIARRRTMPPPVNLPEMQLLARSPLLVAEPASAALN